MTHAISIDVFNIQVWIFYTDKMRRKFLKSKGIISEQNSAAAFASSHKDTAPDDVAWFSMVIPETATMASWAHECVHIADWIMHHIGIPTEAGNTEARAYLVGHIFAGLQEIRGKQ